MTEYEYERKKKEERNEKMRRLRMLGGGALVNIVPPTPSVPQDYVAFYPLTGTAEDVTGNYNGTEVSATYVNDISKGAVFSGTGSITIPATGGTYCSYWVDTGTGWNHITTATIPTSLATNKYSSLRIYNRTLSAGEITAIYDYELVTHYVPVDNGLIAYYPLETNSQDNYYNQYDGVDTSVTYDGASASFNGSTSYISTSTSLMIPVEYSLSVWVKTSTTSLSFITNTKGGYTTSGMALAVQDTTGLVYYGESNSTDNTPIFLSTTNIADGVYHNIIITRTSTGSVNMFVDGVNEVSNGVLGTFKFTTHTYNMILGKIASTTSYYLNGNISNLRSYNRVIDAAEVSEIYNTERTKFGV